MNVLLISQCDKRALTESRRILDQFAERRGQRTWQTPITQAGLDTLRKLLRKTARKNTAVACHWIRGKNFSELLWIVGDASRFNDEGAVPTNTTTRNVLRASDENDWHSLQEIRLLAQLAALLHDLGKASVAFQERLNGKRSERNLYRHEWVSLRLFLAFVGDTKDDESWLTRLADAAGFNEQDWIAPGRYFRDGLDGTASPPFAGLPPIAAAVAWLVLTHHRLPVKPVEGEEQKWLGQRCAQFKARMLSQSLSRVQHDWNEIPQAASNADIEQYWALAGALPVVQPKWRAQAARAAAGLLKLSEQSKGMRVLLDEPYVMHLARMSLMLADHHYSSLGKNDPQRVKGDGNSSIFANTDADGSLKQPLDEHLLGVAKGAGLIAHSLPGFESQLGRLARHKGLQKRSGAGRFAWQDKASDAATGIREKSCAAGGFIINMASTGCGKTLANLRILYAMASPQQGMRATYGLGLRALTLQTGRSYRQDLHLDEDELAILVGGSGSRKLFEYYQEEAERRGSASAQSLIEEDSHVLFEGNPKDHPLLSRAMRDDNIRKLLAAPVLVCTVDHITPATESLRAGRQIAPMLRLMSSDLVLDELDDYEINDLPALTRLVHWAGLLGSRVLLSSATLPPSLVEGMFLAYRAGREQFARHRGERAGQQASAPPTACLWTDEFSSVTADCMDAQSFAQAHQQFIDKRAAKLNKATLALRRGELVPLNLTRQQKPELHRAFAEPLLEACLRLHEAHAQTCPASGKKVSFGLVRMANIEPLINVALALFEQGAPENTRIHLCVYHARFPLLMRSAIEQQLDAALNRRDPDAVYALPDIRAAVDGSAEPSHIFMVLASPVCEVGRDWDADWAVVEPSSMRSIIQLAGRVQRHRQHPSDQANLLIFDTNLRCFSARDGIDRQPDAVFIRPGFEKERVAQSDPSRFASRRLGELLLPEEYSSISALPRVRPRPQAEWQARKRFSEMEHARMFDVMMPKAFPATAAAAPSGRRARSRGTGPEPASNAANCWQFPQAGLTGMLPQYQPFRRQTSPEVPLVFLPDEDEERLLLHRVEEDKNSRFRKLYADVDDAQCHQLEVKTGSRIEHWGKHDALSLLQALADEFDMPLRSCGQRFTTVAAPKNDQGWRYHPWFGLAKA